MKIHWQVRDSIGDPTLSKINSGRRLVIRDGHWESEKEGNNGGRKGGRRGREGAIQTKALTIGQKRSEEDEKDAGAC